MPPPAACRRATASCATAPGSRTPMPRFSGGSAMPSKGGRSRTDAVPVSLPPRPPLDLATISLSDRELARSIGRGWEVDRFNDLARRQEELTPAESDELYRYRLRRLALRERHLERAVAGGSEEELREALDDYRRRLGELRALEEVRDRAELAAGYEMGDVERRASERQLQFAEERPRGLLAGTVHRELGPAEIVRLPEAALAPTAD